MKNFSVYRPWKAFIYPFILGLSLSITPALANNPAIHKLSRNQTKLGALVPWWQFKQQTHQVSGTVSDANGPIPGATVSIKGTKTIAITDFDGKYIISATLTDTLVFSFMGYKTAIVTINGRTTINVKLQEDATTLQEVRVNAGYYSVKESERTGSIAKISTKDIEKQPVTNVLATMQGRMAGVNITQTTGVPGGGFDIQIRGQNSLRTNGNSPLYIIDGVPYSSDPIGSGINSAVLPTQPSPLNSINPDQIESIEVLKDADATAIYGSRGANGVVLITTKKGKAGKTRFSANLSKGIGTVTHFMDLMNTEQFLQMRREAFANDAISPIPNYAYDVNGTWDQKRYTDWQMELMGGTADITNIQTSLSGGSPQTQFLLSGNYNKQTTVLPGDFSYQKGNMHLNVNHESENKKFKTNVSIGYTMQNNNQPRLDLIREAVNIAPNAPALYKTDGTLNWENNTFNNPLRNLEGKYESTTNDLIANMMLSYELIDGLQLKSSFGYTTLSGKETTANPSTMFNPAFGWGPEFSSLIAGGAERKSWIIEPQLNWNKSIGKGKLDVLLGSTFQTQKGNQLVQYAYGFTSNSLIYNLASASNIFTMVSEESEYKYQAFFGRVNYNWQEKYIVNLTGRRDGSSRFGPGKQFATFGAVGAAWLFSKEFFFKDTAIVSFGKLRGSYGITGNDQIGDYQYLNTYGSSGINYGGIVGLEPTRLFNPEFGWETNNKFELALETGFFKDRVFFTAAWYNNHSSNQLTGIPLPGTTGFTSLQANLDATVQNRGVELTLRTLNIQGKNFNWSTNINLTMSRNKLLKFPNLEGSTYANQLVIGEPLNIQKVYHFTGVDPQTGVYTFEDVNGDGLLNAADYKKTIKDFNPKYYGGLQNTLKYKHWQLDFLFQFVKQINYNASVYFGLPGSQNNQPIGVLNHWQNPGDSTPYPIYTDGANSAAVDAFYKYFESDGAVSDASYVRLKNISISYDVPLKDLQCKVFFEGQNVLTFTKYNGADPEFKSAGYLPPLRILSAGVQFSF
ncbi:TonB-linked SusC/RagA family outer membrane protein [Flavobacterium sp. CG_9.10]|uniref:SusC/RagA family TonB-linked outer membrane protein n=1 Tax=Flavobacterium sp. CG_9.10 TaxID=2787729 RepID=UPI0018CA5620|nr:TonB-dependent receptor [Flavobacterium sp. CG_9.10]MBG6109817.1 TonB-linked SusC/RagA family outer membrane protein [Flavobacterium sp. CG_9.10]